VREAAEQGLPLRDIVFPLMNMIASTLANVVVENKLDAAEEIEVVQSELEELYERYLRAYNQQAPRQKVN
jgi:hypothetical protein